jgi:hypothetical protein
LTVSSRPAAGRWPVLPALAVFTFALALYLSTLAPTITWRFDGSDSGELASAAFTWGVAHPTGYPFWTLLGFLATRLPFADPAWRTNFLSAVCGAAAAAFIALASIRLIDRLVPAPPFAVRLVAGVTTGLALAAAPTFWGQSILTEIYSLHSLLLAVVLWLIVLPTPGRIRPALPLACGFALTNHSTSVMLIGLVAGLVLVRGRSDRLPLRAYLWAGLLLVLPLSLYLLLPWRASQHPAENWNDPETLGRFLAHVTGAQYHYLLQWRNPFGALISLPGLIQIFLSQFAWWVLPIALYGTLRLWEIDRPLTIMFVLAACAYMVFTAFYHAQGPEHYLMPAGMIEALLFGVGFAALATELAAWQPVYQLAPRTQVGLLALFAVFTLLPTMLLGYPSHDLRHDYSARDYAYQTLRDAPPNATLRTATDQQTFALWYVQKVEGYRRDVQVIDVRMAPA